MADQRTAPVTGFGVKPTLTGDLVVLRPVTADDVPALMPMFRDAEVARLTGSHGSSGGDEPDRARLHAWYATRGDQGDRLDLAVVERAGGAVVGEAVLNAWDRDNLSCGFRIALVPGAVGRGLGTEATRLILGHAFEDVGVHRVSLEVYAFNARARRVYEKVGFVAEGVLRDALLWRGERVDAAVMSILRPEWQRHGGHPDRRTRPAHPDRNRPARRTRPT
ncbi:GNAT family N-acetyltransferase [Saccharothrix hoggarensis]|uniref:GNAT family N-acetyltransferase n=1 Tax=Saccharothrix hoggarensis TaxID=913853 RepID=A0ABW3QRX7_9PSEU